MATGEHQRTTHDDTLAHEREREVRPLDDVLEYLRAYARQKPETAALVCIGIGFVLGWKLKPW